MMIGRQAAPIAQPVRASIGLLSDAFLQPLPLFRGYQLSSVRPDLIAGLTVAVILLPQAIAYALIAELPPQTGLYAAIVAAIVGALWGSSNHLQTGPTNASSLLVLSSLITMAVPGTPEYLILAGVMAVLEFSSYGLTETLQGLVRHLPQTQIATLSLGAGAMLLIILLRRLNPKVPGPLIAMVVAAAAVGMVGLEGQGVAVIGELPRSLPPLSTIPLLNTRVIGQLAPGALAIAAIGLVEAMSIARSISGSSGQRLDSNQEFVGQGLANIAAGFLSGYPSSGSLTRSAVNFDAEAQTRLASAFSGLFVLVAMLVLAPFAAYVPRAALSGVLILTAYSMVDRKGIVRILKGARADAVIMGVTFLATLFLSLEFAVLSGILLSFAVYIYRSSVPRVLPVLPDEKYRHFVYEADRPPCPQLAVLDILGDLYFGAVSHVEKAIGQHLAANPTQRFLLLRMHSVQQCDFSGIYALESIVRSIRDRGGDLFIVRVRGPVREIMKTTGFQARLGADHFLDEDIAISYLFHKVLDPAVCIYECDVRAFKECQNLPKYAFPSGIPLHTNIPAREVVEVPPRELWQRLRSSHPPHVIDVREAREFQQSHIPQARLAPLSGLLGEARDLPRDVAIVFVCRGGRRSTRAAYLVQNQGYEEVAVLQGGMLAWEAANLLTAVDGSPEERGDRQ
ncbi:MAG: SulP family inorganic anion transporter [Anaerolineae bacterium]